MTTAKQNARLNTKVYFLRRRWGVFGCRFGNRSQSACFFAILANVSAVVASSYGNRARCCACSAGALDHELVAARPCRYISTSFTKARPACRSHVIHVSHSHPMYVPCSCRFALPTRRTARWRNPCELSLNPGFCVLCGCLAGHISMLKDMTEFSTGQSVHGGVSYTGSTYTELQEVIRPQGGDMV